MSDLFGRSFRLAKTYLDDAKGRLDEVSAGAQEELTRALNRDDVQAGLASSDDPMARAQARIAAARATTDARHAVSPASTNAEQAGDPLQTAYKIVGVAPGSDYLTVRTAVNSLRDRCAPSRFPDGSPEQSSARTILKKVEEAHQVLQNALDPGAGRFDKLEI
jgi:hypothetical protein